MGFIALIVALVIEQLRPLPRGNLVHQAAVSIADAIAGATNAGRDRHGMVGWALAVGAAVLAVVVAQWLLGLISPVLVFALHVAVLYFTVGFRQFSHAFTEIQLALAAGDSHGARQALQQWIRQQDPEFVVGDLPISEVCRLAISHALIAAHRHVFGPLFWYMLLPGAVGPVLYRAAQFLAERWQAPLLPGMPAGSGASPQPAVSAGEPYGQFARKAYGWLDWLPVRLAAAGFAIVGNFEDAVYCWRGAAAAPGGDAQRRILLMSGGGALGLRIADPRLEAQVRGTPDTVALQADGAAPAAPVPGSFDWQGAEPDTASLRSAVGLVWRSVVLWILLFAMLTIANWLGR